MWIKICLAGSIHFSFITWMSGHPFWSRSGWTFVFVNGDGVLMLIVWRWFSSLRMLNYETNESALESSSSQRKMGHTRRFLRSTSTNIINWIVRRFGKLLTMTSEIVCKTSMQCWDINYARLQALYAKKTLPKSSNTSRWGQLLCISCRTWIDLNPNVGIMWLVVVMPTRRACGQDAMKIALKSVTKTLRIWGYVYFLKVCSKISRRLEPDPEFESPSIWTVCRFWNKLKQRANSARTVVNEYFSPMNMSR